MDTLYKVKVKKVSLKGIPIIKGDEAICVYCGMYFKIKGLSLHVRHCRKKKILKQLEYIISRIKDVE